MSRGNAAAAENGDSKVPKRSHKAGDAPLTMPSGNSLLVTVPLPALAALSNNVNRNF
jgi:hypothetical protein